VQFRFILKKGNVTGTNISYGWLIDKFELTASVHELKAPVVEFVSSFTDTVLFTGPYLIQAKVAKRTIVDLNTPNLIYTATHPVAGTVTDTLVMTAYQGDSLWEATIPQYIFGTTINYSVRGEDSVGNYATATDGFISKHPIGGTQNDSVLIGTPNGGIYNCAYPWCTMGDGFNWSIAIYHATDLGNASTSKTISGLAYHNTYSYYHVRYNVKCYVKETMDNAMVSAAYIDPIAAGATLVYSGNLNITPQWNPVKFDNVYTVSSGKNLLVWWIDSSSVNTCSQNSGTIFWDRYTPSYNGIAYNGNHFSGCNGGSENTTSLNCPVTKFYFGSPIMDSNSVALEKIITSDTAVAGQGCQEPVVVKIKNKGYADLHTAVIGWSINGVLQTPKTWTGNLPDDYSIVDTIGYFSPAINKYDTIVAWVNMPNSVLDTNTYDDTLTKVVFGAADLQYEWVNVPDDTVYSTGPYQMQLRIWSMSGNSTVSNLNLKYRYKDTTGTWLDSATIAMVNMNNGIWQAAIPNIRYNHHVEYTVSMADYVNNVITVSGYYFIKIGGGGVGSITDSLLYGSNSSNNCASPWVVTGDGTNRNVSVYLNSTMGNPTQPLVGLAYTPYTSMNTSFVRHNVQCYVKATTATTVSAYLDPIAEGATLVYNGELNFVVNGQPWCQVIFDRAYRIPTGQNLMVWWVDTSALNSCSQNSTTIYWAQYSQTDGTYRDAHNYTSGCGGSNINSVYACVPYTQFYFGTEKSKDSASSVALEEFASPTAGSTAMGTQPVQVVIRNQGLIDLTSCEVGYSVDGVVQDTVHWTGVLPADFVDTIDFGTINILPNTIYELTAWVSTPNGVYDSAYYDDTLTISTIACTGSLTGVISVDPSGNGDATSMSSLLYAIKNCGMNGKLTIEVANGTYTEGIDLTDLASIMEATDTLVITSASGIADSVKFVGTVVLGANNNISITNITIDASAGNYGVQLTKPCDNIEISNCIIKANINSTSSSAIYYVGTSSSTPMGRLKILDNTIIGGYYGIQLRYLYPNASTMVTGTGYATIKGNHLSEVGYYGLYLYYYGKYDY
ncbi:MAG: hypothetical protein J5725_11520, partial [Bacteroidales bacterium]|nr:hypothetical protein [Bacteroidales bacterium]